MRRCEPEAHLVCRTLFEVFMCRRMWCRRSEERCCTSRALRGDRLAGVDIDTGDVCDRTPIETAVRAGHVELVNFLLSRGAATTTRPTNFLRHSLLHFAVESASEEMMATILSHFESRGEVAAALTAVDSDGFTPLFDAAATNAFGSLRAILAAIPHATPDYITRWHSGQLEWAALNTAAYRGSTECVALLLEGGANTGDRVAASRSTALHSAARHGHTEIVLRQALVL